MARIDTLGNFLTDVATAIKDKTGNTEALKPADFDTEIASIVGGGGEGEDLTEELNTYNTELINQDHITNLIALTLNNKAASSTLTEITDLAVLNNEARRICAIASASIDKMFAMKPTILDTPATLYTPASDHLLYFIRKTNQSKYSIVWVKQSYFLKQYSSKTIVDIGLMQLNIIRLYDGGTANGGTVTFSATSASTYYSKDFDTLDECLAAIQDPTTTYTQKSANGYPAVPDGKLMVPATNMCCLIDLTTSTYGDTKRISPLETIEPIPTEGV